MGFDFDAFAAECPSAIVVVNDAGSIVFANRAFASLVGKGLREVDRQSFAPLVPARHRPAEGVGWTAHLHTAAGYGRRIVWPLVHRSGTEIESDWTILPGHDAAGRDLVEIVFTQRASIPVADASTHAEQVHKIIFENAPIGVFHFDARGVLTACNPTFVRLIGSSARQLVGLDMLTLPSAAIVDVAKKTLQGELTKYDGPYTSATGNRTTSVVVVMAPIFDDGVVVGGVGLVEDVTDQRRASELIARTERLTSLGTLAAGVVHEVQNPLAYVIANLDVALRTVDKADPNAEGTEAPASSSSKKTELRAALTAAREGASRVALIARDLKTFAKSDESVRGPVDLAEAIATSLKLTQNSLKGNAKVSTDIHGVGTVWASEPRLVQLFVNLLLNAIDGIERGGGQDNAIRIVAKVLPDGRRRVDIEDTGKGVAPEDASRVFEPFWTQKPNGMGLGLAICHGIVESLGGEIFLDADRPVGSRGARFSVILPARSGTSASIAPAPPPPVAEKPVERAPVAQPVTNGNGDEPRGKLLVVDDELRLAEILRMTLSASYDVDVATRGRRALELLLHPPTATERDFDVVLCDIMLPDFTGAQLFQEVSRSRPDLAERFVFLTGGVFTESIRQFLHDVSNPRIEKPFDLDQLEHLVAQRVKLARLR